MAEEKLVKCDACGKMCPENDVFGGECSACRTADRASDMTVGDSGGR